ncbi:MAG: spondin domain-containing protein [Phormidesmis sp.]
MKIRTGTIAGAIAAAFTFALAPMANAATLRITVNSLAPENGTFLTPAWFGFHDGNFDLYDRGQSVTPGLERLAEDGDVSVLSEEFDTAGDGSVQGAVAGTAETPGPIDPGESASFTVDLDASAASSRYFSYASMVIPSNDFFVANGNPLAHRIFDDAGNFIGADFVVSGAQVLDAGTEVNDELPENTAFFGQQAPDTGVSEGGVVELADGFMPGGNILSSADFANADFTADGYDIARFQVELVDDEAAAVPEPGVVLGLLAMGGLLLGRRRYQRA